ncbi:hypothetical protein FHS23_002261 [Prauserella isguenensis]|uniref:Uncharacterized protein n=1 Tax=Prauserella isguenensis TaxID=1470180 RepID=A0A839S092_9PSEU|nr:hypothetical protein [Prauserella isguenensis]MBB3051238.1 hypothetical protein [Prauserella isguenensis]
MTSEENEEPTGEHVAEVREGSASVNNSVLIDSVVHTSTHYHLDGGASYEDLLREAITMLDTRARTKAIEYLHDARAKRDTTEARFYLAIALLSNRSFRDLKEHEEQELLGLTRFLNWYDDQRWKPALSLVCELARRHRNGETGGEHLVGQINELGPIQKRLIDDHLRHVLDGESRERLWAARHQDARNRRIENDRRSRVWAYFCAKPANARARTPRPDATTLDDLVRARVWLAVFTVSATYIGWLTVSTTNLLMAAIFLLAVGSTFVGVRCGVDWHYRSRRVAGKDRQYTFDPFKRRSDSGFAGDVTFYFDRYFRRYAPEGVDEHVYLKEVAGFKAFLRDEIVEIYREQKVGCSNVRWLIRDLAKEVQSRYEDRKLHAYHERYRTPTAIKRWCVLGVLSAAAGWITTVVQLSSLSPLRTTIAVLIAATAGAVSMLRWDHIVLERRRAFDDRVEYDEEIAQRERWLEEWKQKIDDALPSETEMQSWLEYDLTLLLDQILKTYRLSWKDVIRDATLLSPPDKRHRARIRNGPWRYTRYEVHIFLLTKDGVREVTTELDFKGIRFGAQSRHNFRFDAVSSIYVERATNGSHQLQLSLMNGDPRPIRVADTVVDDDLREGEDPDRIAEMNLDASGFVHTLRLLEGIAAEGKEWIRREPVHR